jgi:hypothetical protein
MQPTRYLLRSASCALLFGAVLASRGSAQEPLTPCSTGQQPMCYGEHSFCSISPVSDQDVYQFFGEAGDRVRLSITTATTNLDPRVELFLPSGVAFTPPGSLFCSADQFNICSFGNEFTLIESGMHTCVLSDSGNDNTGNYYFTLERIAPHGVLPQLDYGSTMTLNTGYPGDVDWFQFNVEAATNLRLSFTGLTANLDPRVRVYTPDGQTVQADVGCNCDQFNICTFVVNFPSAPASGVYTAMFYDAGLDNTGSCNVTLSCLVGNCPPAVVLPEIGSTFCTTNPNTTASLATIKAFGSRHISDNDVFLKVTGAPANKVAIFFVGVTPNPAPALLPFSEGVLCILPPVTRLPLQFTCSLGSIERQLDLSGPVLAPLVAPGQATYFQAWFRDPTASGSTFDTNTSDGLMISFL